MEKWKQLDFAVARAAAPGKGASKSHVETASRLSGGAKFRKH
jgi:hypothetical protein